MRALSMSMLLSVAAVVLLLGVGAAQAATVIFDTVSDPERPTTAIGIDGLVVDGTTYNVEFTARTSPGGTPWESQPGGGRRFTSHPGRRPTGRYGVSAPRTGPSRISRRFTNSVEQAPHPGRAERAARARRSGSAMSRFYTAVCVAILAVQGAGAKRHIPAPVSRSRALFQRRARRREHGRPGSHRVPGIGSSGCVLVPGPNMGAV
jgi:hypothetical protein